MPKLPSKEYWERRSELTLIQNEKSALQYEKDLKKAYQAAIKQITKEIEAFYGRYAKENQITLLEARKRLTPKELLDFNQHAKIYLDEVERLGDKAFTAEYKAYLKELSGRAYVSRIEELITNIRHNIETLSTGYNIGLGQILTEAYEDSFYRTMFDIQKQAGFGVSFTTPGGKQLEMAIRERWMGQNYSDRIWVDKNRLIIQLEQMLSQEFVRGRGPREVAKDFSDKMQTSYHNAQRLIRTELNYISNKGSIKAYEESGVVEKYQYLATLDSRTSDICRELDGKIFELKEAKVGVNLPPLHPHCRSTTIPYFEDNEIEDRVARDEDGKGKSYKLGKDVTFFEWVEQYGSESFRKKVTAQRAKFKGMDMTSSITEASVAEEILKAFDPNEYETLTQEEVIESMKAFYGGEDVAYYDMPDEYQSYVATANSFKMNRFLYSGRYDDIKSGKVSPNDGDKILINQVEAFKDYIDKAPNLPKSTKLVRFINGEAFEGMVNLVVRNPEVANKITGTIRGALKGQEDKEVAKKEFTSHVAGVMFEANSFMSTSYDIEQNAFISRDYQLEIYADKGANALMTYNHDEAEVILNVGSRLEFMDVEIKGDKAVVKMRAHSIDKKFTD